MNHVDVISEEIRFELLGPLAVDFQGHRWHVSAPRQRTVLAKLLLEAGRVVSLESLIDALWEHSPPATARSQVQICVSLLRRAMASLGVTHDPVETQPTGYLVRLDRCALDARLFRHGVEEAVRQAARGEVGAAHATMSRALDWWTGPACSGVDSPVVRAGAARLDEERLTALETLTDWDLELGRHEPVIGLLRERVAQHPLRERSRGQLMLALYRAGRRPEALEVYRAGRDVLAAELGLDPGEHLSSLEKRILRGDRELLGSRKAPIRVGAVVDPTRADEGLVERGDATAAVVSALGADRSRHVAVVGGPGAGKSVLAASVAHRLADGRFPDGVLHAEVGGAVDVHEVLRHFLEALGVPPERVPRDDAERAARYQEVVGDRAVLVVLDGVHDHAAVRALVPAGRRCAALVTSRSAPRDPRVDVVELGAFTEAEAMLVVERVAGRAQVTGRRDAVRPVLEAVGRWPAAVRAVAERLRGADAAVVAGLAARLSDDVLVLDELAASGADLRAELLAAYQVLSADARRVLRLMADFDAAVFSDWTAAAASGLTADRALQAVAELRDAGLVGPAPSGHRLPALTRAFGKERMRAEEPHLAGTLQWVV